MTDLMSDSMFRPAAGNIMTLAWLVAALLLLGAALSGLKNLARALWSGAVRRGDGRVPRSPGKPAVGLLAVLALMTGAAGYGGARFFPLAAAGRELAADGLDDDLERLHGQMDQLHAAGVAREARSFDAPVTRRVPGRRPDYRHYRSYSAHKQFTSAPVLSLSSVTVVYHRQCAVCEQNFRLRLKIDAIYERQAREEKALRRKRQFIPAGILKGEHP